MFFKENQVKTKQVKVTAEQSGDLVKIVPSCEISQTFAEIAEKDCLSLSTLRKIKSLGFELSIDNEGLFND